MIEAYNYLRDNKFKYVKYNEELAKHTSFRVGGKVSILVEPTTKEEIIELVLFLHDKKIPFKVLGNGSNILPSDNEYHGVIIKTQKALNYMSVNNDKIIIGSGYNLIKLAYDMVKYELTGCEFLGGIPGTIGGAVFMNAGAYNKEMKDIVEKVVLINKDGKKVTYENQDLQYQYRSSILQKEKPLLIIEAVLKLEKGSGSEIKRILDSRRMRRLKTQPLNYPSGGSTFRNPQGSHAYMLIDKAGLRGYQIGGAKVSDKHCNFIINYNQAKSTDIKNLVDYVIEKVYQVTNVRLIPEIEFFNWDSEDSHSDI